MGWQVKALMADSMRAVASRLNRRKINHCFEVFGFDCMVDSQYHVWLIEANENPGLEFCNDELAELKTRMLDEAFHLALDSIHPRAAGRTSTSMSLIAGGTGWEFVFCSSNLDANKVSCSWAQQISDPENVDLVSLDRSVLFKTGTWICQ